MLRLGLFLGLLGYTMAGYGGELAKTAPLAVEIKRLTLESAYKLAWGAIQACRQQGVSIAVVVMDRGAHPQVILRDTLAPDLTLAIATKKAYTALSFNVPTADLSQQRLQSGLAYHSDLMLLPGGVPIQAGGIIYGAVGVSGAPSGETDAHCAQAGIQELLKELDFE